MIDRREFHRKFAAIAAFTAADAGAQQTPPAGPPATGRGQMDGSPVGDPLPGQKWRVHDRNRPQPRKVTPGQPVPSSSAPSDAIVLFDGKDLSKWNGATRDGTVGEPKWKVENGYVELVPRAGSLVTKDSFGDVQLHLEWMTPPVEDPARVGQFRGNSGVIFMGHYELQVLSSYNNPTYPDGSAAGIYGLYPPMVNPCFPEGQWNSYDVIFEAPRFEGEKLTKPACMTVLFNGVLVHHRAELLGDTSRLPLAAYKPHAPELPLTLQGHVGPARYRNIWIRRLLGYDA